MEEAQEELDRACDKVIALRRASFRALHAGGFVLHDSSDPTDMVIWREVVAEGTRSDDAQADAVPQ